MYDFTEITRTLVAGRDQLLDAMNGIGKADTIVIYDPIIGEDWLKPFVRTVGTKKDPHGVILPVKMIRQKNNDEALPAPVILQCHIKPAFGMVYSCALYYDMGMQEILVRSGVYLSKDRDWNTDDTLKHTLLSFKPDHEFDPEYKYIKRYADRDGEALYGQAGYTDIVVPTSDEIINV